jgi:O-antigen/teichoic acid export membrane protein
VPEGIAQKTLAPRIARLNAQGSMTDLETVLRAAAAWASVPSVFLLAVYLVAAGPLLGFLYGDFYRNGVTALIVLGLGQAFNVTTGLCGTTMIMTGHQRSLLIISTLCSLLAAILALILARPFGVFGVAASSAIGFSVQAASMLIFVKRKLGIWTHIGFRQALTMGR